MTAVEIGEQQKALIELQAVDHELYQLKRQRAAKPVQIEQRTAAFQADAKQVTTLEEQVKALQVKRNGMEGELAAKETSVKKLQGQLYAVKTNKEYTVLQHEIAGVKADNSVLEEEILKVMDQVDQQKAAVATAKEALKGREAQHRAAVAVIEREMAELDAAIAQLVEQRAGLTPRVDRKLLAQYERILDKKDGLGLVPVRVQHEACGGCHMNIPPQTINEIRLKERWITCGSCARLLYYPEESIAAS